MSMFSPKGKIHIDEFPIYLMNRVRLATRDLARAGYTEDQCLREWARHIGENYETVKRVATMGEEPSINMLKKLGLKLGKPYYVKSDFKE